MAIRISGLGAILGVVLLLAVGTPAAAVEWWDSFAYRPPTPSGPYPTERGSFSPVLRSDACWHTCAAHCGGQFQTCVKGFWINDCRTQDDRCELSCQKTCRTYGGPLLNITD